MQGALSRSRGIQELIFETEFAVPSYGLCPGRTRGLKSCFDTIPHERLLELVTARVADGRVLALVECFLRAGVMEEAKAWQPTERGTSQGDVISPLLANLYRDPLDHRLAKAGWEMMRYADDFVILCRTEAEAQNVLEAVGVWVNEAGLTLHPEKTRMATCGDDC